MELFLLCFVIVLLLILAAIQFASCLSFLLGVFDVLWNLMLTVISIALLVTFLVLKTLLAPLLGLAQRSRRMKRRMKQLLPWVEDHSMGLLELIVEIPLAITSFLYNKTVKGTFQKAKSAVSPNCNSSEEGTPWWGNWFSYLLSDAEMNGGTLSQSAFFTASVVGPRWNTHGGSHMSAFMVSTESGAADVHIENLQTPGFWWRATVLHASGKELGVITPTSSSEEYVSARVDLPTADLGEDDAPEDDDAETERTMSDEAAKDILADKNCNTKLTVWLHHYFYGDCSVASIPSVRLQNKEVIGSLECKRASLDFLGDLRSKQGNTHLALNWYVFVMLSFRRFLPKSYVDAEMLPGRNSSVAVRHGIVFKSSRLLLETRQSLLDDHLIFCTVYNRASVPIIRGIEMQEMSMVLPCCPEDGCWQIRVVRRDALDVDQEVTKQIAVRLQSVAEDAQERHED